MRRRSASEFQRQTSRRLWTAVGFLIALVLVGMGLFAYSIAALLTSGNPRALVTDLSQAADCARNHLKPTAEAVDRYYRDKGEYPEHLADLYPLYLENRQSLFCPADPNGTRKETSFIYRPPVPAGEKAPLLVCPHHAQVRLEVHPGKHARPGFGRWEIRAEAKRTAP